jgi:CheY-like chemotaxis protein
MIEREKMESGVDMELSVVVHDLKIPLTAILGYAELIAKDAGAADNCRNAAAIILNNSQYMLQIIDNLLKNEETKFDVSTKNSAIDFTPNIKPVELRELLESIYQMFSNQTKKKRISFNISCKNSIPSVIKTDFVLLKRVLVNLVGNAVKFTKKGGINISLKWIQNNQNQTTLQLDIQDTGIGINQDSLTNLFKPFSQEDNSIKQNFGGTGLGLYISKQIANRLGGDITAQSTKNLGTTFTLTITAAAEDGTSWINENNLFGKQHTTKKQKNKKTEGKNESAKNTDTVEEKPLRGCRVLLVDDSLEIGRLFGLILDKAGADLTYISQSRDALEQILENKFDIVLLDMEMPIIDGRTIAKQARDKNYKGQIIALTGHNSREYKQSCLNAGCNNFAPKPILKNELVNLIKNTLNLDNSHEEGNAQEGNGR